MPQAPISNERIITTYRSYFLNHLNNTNVERRIILKEFKALIDSVKKQFPKKKIHKDNEGANELYSRVAIFLKKHFTDRVYNDYKNPSVPSQNTNKNNQINRKKEADLDALLGSIKDVAINLFLLSDEKAAYRFKLLMHTYNCFVDCGLHELIDKRSEEHKTYNLSVGYISDGEEYSASRILMPLSVIAQEYREPYSKKIPISLSGKLIKFDEIEWYTVSSSLLNETEAELLLLKKGYKGKSLNSQKNSFTNICKKEENFFPNPHILESQSQSLHFRNNAQTIISEERIEVLKTIDCKEFDLQKLIRLCEELNNNAISGNWYSVCFLSRAVIDYVPPILGFNDFKHVASNYPGRSIKKNFKNLQESLRNISDGHIHGPARKSESLPTQKQIDFSPDLDVLLGEIIRVLNEKK